MKKLNFAIVAILALALQGLTSCGNNEKTGARDREDREEGGGSTKSGIAATSLIPVSTDGKTWGFVNQEGKVVAPGAFSEAPSLPYNGYFIVAEPGGYSLYKLIGKDGKYEAVAGMSGFESIGYFADGLIPATLPEGKIRLYDGNGKMKFELDSFEGEEIEAVDAGYSDGRLMFLTSSGKIGFFDTEGNVAVRPDYKTATQFSDGIALVAKTADPSDIQYIAIDKQGNELFRLGKGETPVVDHLMKAVSNGYILANSDTRTRIYNKKGEMTQMPSRIQSLERTDGKYMIFRAKDGKAGVADMKGEIVVEPTYGYIWFNGGYASYMAPPESSGFIAMESMDNEADSKSYLISNKGKIEETYPYRWIDTFGKFGYFATLDDGNGTILVDKKGKQKGDAVFKEINGRISLEKAVHSDFNNLDGVAKDMAAYVNEFSIGPYALGATPYQVMGDDAEPRDHLYQIAISLTGLNTSNGKFTTGAYGYFSENMGGSEWSPYSESYYYYWNYDSRLVKVDLNFIVTKGWGEKGAQALIRAFKDKGYTVEKQGYCGGMPAALLVNGDIAVLLTTNGDGSGGTISVVDKSLSGAYKYYSELRNEINS